MKRNRMELVLGLTVLNTTITDSTVQRKHPASRVNPREELTEAAQTQAFFPESSITRETQMKNVKFIY
jgi:hypothetical protein